MSDLLTVLQPLILSYKQNLGINYVFYFKDLVDNVVVDVQCDHSWQNFKKFLSIFRLQLPSIWLNFEPTYFGTFLCFWANFHSWQRYSDTSPLWSFCVLPNCENIFADIISNWIQRRRRCCRRHYKRRVATLRSQNLKKLDMRNYFRGK